MSSSVEISSNNDDNSSEEKEFEISSNLCRLCLTRRDILKSMFHCYIGSKSYAEIFEETTSFKIHDEPQLPVRICNNCENNLVGFHEFLESLKEVEIRLESAQSSLEIDSRKEEIHIVTGFTADNLIVSSDDPEPTFDNTDDFYDDSQIIGEDPEEPNEESEIIADIQDPTNEELELTEEEYEVEQLYDEDELIEIDSDYQEPKLVSCKFAPSPVTPKYVKCQNCDDCELEKTFNSRTLRDECVGLQCGCEKFFKNRRSFLKHFSTAHEKKENTYKCKSCPNVYSIWRSRMAHEANVHGIGLKFNCQKCEKKFYRRDHLNEHVKNCNKTKEIRITFFSCKICLFTFQREESYLKHLETAHPDADEGDTECVERAEKFAQRTSRSDHFVGQNGNSQLKTISCEFCRKNFKNEMSLNKHVSLMHSNQLWPCDQCDAVFVHRSTRLSHTANVHGARKPHECNFPGCAFSCFKRDRFQAHMDKHDNPNWKFPCPICQQEFTSYNTMTLHRAKHLSNNTFECEFCQKQFLDKRNFNAHLKLHTGKDLFHCPVCNQGFNKKEHMQKHQTKKNHYDEYE